MEFLNHKTVFKVSADSNCDTNLMKELFESQSTGLAELYEEINKTISINKIIEENENYKEKDSRSKTMSKINFSY